MMKAFTVKFCLADSEYMTALRLVVGAVCSAADMDVDAIEDMKVCVTESCLILRDGGFECVTVTLNVAGGFSAEIEGEGGTPKAADSDFSLALVSALVAECDLKKEGGIITKLTLKL